MFIWHVNAKEDLAVKTESTLETCKTPGESKVGQNVVLGSVPGFHDFLAKFALPSSPTGLQFTVRVQSLNSLFLDHNLDWNTYGVVLNLLLLGKLVVGCKQTCVYHDNIGLIPFRVPLLWPWINVMWFENEFLFFNIFPHWGHSREGVSKCKVSTCLLPLPLFKKSLPQIKQLQLDLLSDGSIWARCSSKAPKMKHIIVFCIIYSNKLVCSMVSLWHCGQFWDGVAFHVWTWTQCHTCHKEDRDWDGQLQCVSLDLSFGWQSCHSRDTATHCR